MNARLLAADIGGTKTLLCLARGEGDEWCVEAKRRFASPEYGNFDSLLKAFLDEAGIDSASIASACLAVAGPVTTHAQGQRARVTNLPWVLESRQLKERFGLRRVLLVNDFAAVAVGVTVLEPHSLHTLQPGNRPPNQPAPGDSSPASPPILVAGAGTGFGAALLVPEGENHRILASESGHADFAPGDEQQAELAAWLRRRLGRRCTVEDLLSGRGLVRVYAFVSNLKDAEDPALPDPPAVTAAAKAGDRRAIQAIALFCRIYGTTVGNLALFSLPYGGIHLAGGIAPKLLPWLEGRSQEESGFLNAFLRKGKMAQLMERFPVSVVTDTEVGLKGALHLAERSLATVR